MNRPLLPLILISLLFPLSCGGKDGGALGVDEPIDLGPPLVLQPHELCSDSDNPTNTIGTFADANVEALVRYYFINQFNQTQGAPLFCPLLAQVSHLEALSVALGIESLVGVQNLPGGVIFGLDNNLITDLSPLRGLRNLSEPAQAIDIRRGVSWFLHGYPQAKSSPAPGRLLPPTPGLFLRSVDYRDERRRLTVRP